MPSKIPSFFYMLKSRLKGKYFLYEFYFKGKRTLDLGCGEGEFLSFDRERIVGVDINERAVSGLKERGFNVGLATAGQLPFADCEFEMVHCHNVIEHLQIDEALSMLREAGRVLRQGGQMVLSSEMPTSKFWETFGHVKPYPPAAIIKLFRPDSREGFEALDCFEYRAVFFLGDHFRNKAAYLMSVLIARYLPLLRREYFLILEKK